MANEVINPRTERSWTVNAAPDTPLLYVLSGELQLNGRRFGLWHGPCILTISAQHGGTLPLKAHLV